MRRSRGDPREAEAAHTQPVRADFRTNAKTGSRRRVRTRLGVGAELAIRFPVAPARRLHAFADSAAFARGLARATRLASSPVRVHRFPDGESLVRVAVPTSRDAYLVRSLHDPNAKLIETLLAADALRRGGAKTVTLIAPYLPYMRQDKVFRPGESLSQHVIGRLLRSAFDGVVTVEAHLHRVSRLRTVTGGASRSLSAAPAIAAWLGPSPEPWLVGPDAESTPWIRAIASTIGASWVVATKERRGDRRVVVHVPALPRGVRAVIVDDIASTGTTIAATARALRRAGVGIIDAVVVHPIFAPGARARIAAAGVRHLVSCNTIPHPTNAISVAPLVAAALARRP